jgi:hypothetical protein
MGGSVLSKQVVLYSSFYESHGKMRFAVCASGSMTDVEPAVISLGYLTSERFHLVKASFSSTPILLKFF